jgi:chaperonin GroEL
VRHTHLLVQSAAREKILHGALQLADAVRVTLGPRSKCVLIDKKWGRPLVCNDGVTIAREFELEDRDENLGVQIIREAAERTGDVVGDGTTTATLLAAAIFADGVRNIAAGASAIDLKRGLDRGLKVVLERLKAVSQPVSDRRQRVQVATISAHNDVAVGEIVADALERVGVEGSTTVEDAKGTETAVEIVEGMRFDRGYLSPFFVTDTEKMRAILEEPLILVCARKIASLADLLPLLEQVAKGGSPLLVIADEVEGDALATLVVNRVRGVLACAAVKAPAYGDRRRAILEDITAVTGAKLIADELGIKLQNVGIDDLGRARRVIMDKDSTTIVGGGGSKELVSARVADIRGQIKAATSDYDREALEGRLARLTGGVAVIRVGAPSEAEMKNRREAFEDAISATKAAITEGIVPGAGLSLLRTIDSLEQEAQGCAGDERTGVLILRHAMEAPTRQIAENSGVDGGVVIDRMRAGAGAFGFDAAKGTYVDLLESGIVDATKVVRVALENAVSVAGVLLLTEATLTEVPEPKSEAREPAGVE